MDVSKRNTHFSHKAKSHLHYLLMHLSGEKIRRKNFFVDVWLEGGGENWWGSSVFSSGPPKCFFFEKISGVQVFFLVWSVHCLSFFLSLFFFNFFFNFNFFYDFLGKFRCSSFFFFWFPGQASLLFFLSFFFFFLFCFLFVIFCFCFFFRHDFFF